MKKCILIFFLAFTSGLLQLEAQSVISWNDARKYAAE